jgi:hypothetical protein
MDITNLFEKVFGLYLIISGILVVTQQDHVMSMARVFGKDQALRMAIGGLITLGGLFMTVAYYDWTTISSSIITIVGWLILLKGLVYFVTPEVKFQKMLADFNRSNWYSIFGIISVIIGAYLAAFGFGWLM